MRDFERKDLDKKSATRLVPQLPLLFAPIMDILTALRIYQSVLAILIAISLFCTIQLGHSQPIVPSWWSVNSCDYLPEYYLSDVNPQSPTNNGREYGLYYTNITNVIIVGLYLADVDVSIENAIRQEQLGNDLIDMGYTVKNVILNYYAPLSCALDGECVIPWGYWSSNKCRGYIAGCPPGDSRLTFDKWQKALTDAVTLPVFQDVPTQLVWDWFGGLTSDVFIYDSQGRLYEYLCNGDNSKLNPAAWDCPNPLIGGGLRNQTSYELALSAAVDAANSDVENRCKAYDMKNDYYNAIAEYDTHEHMMYYVDDWYYYNDFGWSGTSNSYDDNSNDPSSDGHFISVSRRHTSHSVHHKLPSKYVYASLFAVVFVAVTVTMLYRRWKRNQSLTFLDGSVRFTQLATEDDDDVVLHNAGVGVGVGLMDSENVPMGTAVIGIPSDGTENKYGSL